MVHIEAESEFTASSLQHTYLYNNYNNSFDSSYCYLACLSLFLERGDVLDCANGAGDLRPCPRMA